MITNAGNKESPYNEEKRARAKALCKKESMPAKQLPALRIGSLTIKLARVSPKHCASTSPGRKKKHKSGPGRSSAGS
eukprot:1157432-Pelagomonas_calceolata.AAC.2